MGKHWLMGVWYSCWPLLDAHGEPARLCCYCRGFACRTSRSLWDLASQLALASLAASLTPVGAAAMALLSRGSAPRPPCSDNQTHFALAAHTSPSPSISAHTSAAPSCCAYLG